MAFAGLGDDLLLANETLDAARPRHAGRAGTMPGSPSPSTRTRPSTSRPRPAPTSSSTSTSASPAADAGPRTPAAWPSGRDRAACSVRGVMGYEGHVVGNPDREARTAAVAESMDAPATRPRRGRRRCGLRRAAPGTYDLHDWATEVQAGSYLLMDTAYSALDLPFRQALSVWATVISVSPGRWAVARCRAQGVRDGPRQPDGRRSPGLLLQ